MSEVPAWVLLGMWWERLQDLLIKINPKTGTFGDRDMAPGNHRKATGNALEPIVDTVFLDYLHDQEIGKDRIEVRGGGSIDRPIWIVRLVHLDDIGAVGAP